MTVSEALRQAARTLTTEYGFDDPLTAQEVARRARVLGNEVEPLLVLAAWLDNNHQAADIVADLVAGEQGEPVGLEEMTANAPGTYQDLLRLVKPAEDTLDGPEASEAILERSGGQPLFAFQTDGLAGEAILLFPLGKTGNLKVRTLTINGKRMEREIVINIGHVLDRDQQRVAEAMAAHPEFNSNFAFEEPTLNGQIGVPPGFVETPEVETS